MARPGLTLLLLAGLHLLSSASGAEAQQAQFDTVLAIGLVDGPEEYLFAALVGVAPAPGGGVIVLDAEYRNIRVFDASGRFVREMGRQGQGPAEFLRPLSMMLVDSTIYVTDLLASRLSAFEVSGRYVDDRSLPRVSGRSSRYLFPLRHGFAFMVAAAWYSTEGTDNRELLVVAPEAGADDPEILSAHHPGSIVFRARPPSVDMLVPSAIAMAPEMVWAVGGDSLVVTVDGYRGDVRWYAITPSGLVQRTTRALPWEPQPFGPADVRALHNRVLERNPRTAAGIRPEELLLPPFAGRAWRASVDDRGDVWINLFDQAERATTSSWVIVPMAPGEPTRSVQVPDGFNLRTVAGELLYGTSRGDLGVSVVQVLRLRDG